MKNKTTRIISIILMIVTSLMLIMSGVMKLIASPQVVEGLGKAGLGNYIALFGVIELVSVALFLYPKTSNVGFFLICSYLGGALSIELATAQFPTAAIILAITWLSVFLKNKVMFLPNETNK